MKEFIPYTPETETSEARYAWDEVLRGLAALGQYDQELDVYEAITDLKDESLEDAYMMVFNYAVNIMTPEAVSDDLEGVMPLLQENGMMEGWEEDDEV